MVDADLNDERREKLRSKLIEGGLGYTLTAAELIVARWLLTLLAVAGVAWLVATYRLWTSSYLLLLIGLIPLAFFYVDIWLRDAAKTRRLRIEKDFPFLPGYPRAQHARGARVPQCIA